MSSSSANNSGYGGIPTNPTVNISSESQNPVSTGQPLQYNFPPNTTSSASGCGSDGICDCIGDSLSSIAASQQWIAQTLYDRLGKECENLDKCIDNIASRLKEKWEHGQKSCEECKSMLRAGMAGTIEYAIACTGSCISEASTSCSPGDGKVAGDKCTGCGQEPCCCKDFACVPCPEEETPKKKYQGWCNPITKVVIVTREGDAGPGADFIAGPLTDTEEVALEQAQIYCGPREKSRSNYNPQAPNWPQLKTPTCDLSQYNTSSGIRSFLSGGIGAATQAAVYNAVDVGYHAIADFLPFTDPVEATAGAAKAALLSPLTVSVMAGPAISAALGCGNSEWEAAYGVLAGISYIEKLVGIDLREWREPYRYAMNAACRNKQLTASQATAAFLSNSISREQLETHWSINGMCPESVQWNLMSERAKPIPMQLGMLRLRELISPSDYMNGMRQLGYLEPQVIDNLFQLHTQLPPMTEIIRYMVRDAGDEGLVQQLQMDTGFTEKYSGVLKKYAKQQGIPDEIAKLSWRAHWAIPSPTQLFEFWHRLRNTPQFGGPAKLMSDIKAALIQQDILPYWHEHYLAVSYRPMGRVDIRRSFEIGSLKEDQLVPAYVQLGYSDETAESLRKFSVKLRAKNAVSHRAVRLYTKFLLSKDEAKVRMVNDGLPEDIADKALTDSEAAFESSPYAAAFVRGDLTRDGFFGAMADHGVSNDNANRIADLLALRKTNHWALQSYLTGSLSKDQATDQMRTDGLSIQTINQLLTKAERMVDNSFVEQCQRGIKRRYLLGDLNADEAKTELTARGTTSERADKMVGWWNCEKLSNGKQVYAAKLCVWLANGIIAAGEFIKRLKRLGYDDTTANLLLADCLGSISAKRLAQAQKEAKDQEAAARRAAQIANRTAASEQRRLQALSNARKKSATMRAGRDKQLFKAAENISNAGKLSFHESASFVREAIPELQNIYGLPTDEALQTLVVASENWDGNNIEELAAAINELALSAQQANLAPPFEDVYVAPIMSG